MTTPATKDNQRTVELVAAILMSVATVITSWCAFQAAIWNGIQTFSLAQANKESRQSMNEHLEANQRRLLDVQMFEEFVKAKLASNARVADFYEERFRPEMKVALKAWLALDPFENPAAPPHPLAMAEYKSELDEHSVALGQEAEKLFTTAREANRTADTYTLFTVLFAMVLLFGGLSTTMEGSRRRLMLMFGASLFLICSVWVATLKVSFE